MIEPVSGREAERTQIETATAIEAPVEAAGELDAEVQDHPQPGPRLLPRRAILMTLLLSGPRIGELVAEPWADVDLANGRIAYDSKTPAGGRWVRLLPNRGRRGCPLPGLPRPKADHEGRLAEAHRSQRGNLGEPGPSRRPSPAAGSEWSFQARPRRDRSGRGQNRDRFGGNNDIGLPPMASADEVIGGLQQVVERLKAAGFRVVLGTLTPAGGYTLIPTYGDSARNAIRTEVNHWIRLQKVSDGIVDFDAALRDPADHSRLLPAFDSGDHLHPSTAGYEAMAAAVRVNRLGAGKCG